MFGPATVEQWTLSYNVPWAIAGLVVLLICTWALVTKRHQISRDTTYFLLGQALEGFAVFIHRGYWAMARYAKGTGDDATADWMWDNADVLQPMVGLMILGIGLFLRGFLVELLGKWWLLGWIVHSFAWAVIGFYAIPLSL